MGVQFKLFNSIIIKNGVTEMIIQSNGAVVQNAPQIKIPRNTNYSAPASFSDSLARQAGVSELPNIEKKSVPVVSREVDPVKAYEELTMREVDSIQRSSKSVYGKEWDDKLLASFIGGLDTNIDISKAVNWNSTGDAELTNEQILELRSKYNLESLSPQENYNLLADLTNMNAISAEDIVSMFVNKLPPQGSYIVETDFYGSVPFGHGNIFDSICSELDALGGLKNFMLSDEFWKMNPNASKDRHSDYISFINQRTKRFNRLLQILTAIRG